MVFICPGCKSRFRVKKAPKSGRIKCPRCGLVSMLPAPSPEEVRADQVEAVPEPPAELSPNTTVAGHQILEYVGGSRYTASYKASQTSMGRTVLFKVLRSEHAKDESVKGRFFAAARAAARLNHPNLLSVFDMGEDPETGMCFYTTECVAGGTLPMFLRAQERMPSEQRVQIANQVAQALAYAHSAGVEQVWLTPDDVLLTDKGDVRVSRVGTGAPLEGGEPLALPDALTRLLYLVATGSEPPADVEQLAAAESLPFPLARDALASKFHALVTRLFQAEEAELSNPVAVAGELRELVESVQRRGTVHASSAPGGVVPLHLERAHRRELPVTGILVGVGIAAALCAIVGFWVWSSIRSRRRLQEAAALWNRGRVELAKKETRYDALQTFRELARQYPDTPHGRTAASEGIEKAEAAVVADAYGAAEATFKDRPREKEAAIAAITAARERLRLQLPNSDLVDEQARVRLRNVRTRYTAAAIRDWNQNAQPKIQSFYGRMQYGKALEEAQAFRRKWPESEKIQTTVTKVIIEINQRAQEKFDEIMKKVRQLRAEGKRTEADDWLGRIIRNFGIPKYVELAEAEMNR
jgi:hypothetical protein